MDPSILDAFAARSLRVPTAEIVDTRRRRNPTTRFRTPERRL